jgi:pyrroline-5-carboxylate reductase
MSAKVVLVGCGNMGHAMLGGWLASGRLDPSDVVVVEPAETLRRRAADLGAGTATDASGLDADQPPALIVLAVKPQLVEQVLPAYRRLTDAGAVLLSVAAGVGIAAYQRILGPDAAIIRCMPNTPASIGLGMMVSVDNGKVGADTARLVHELLAASGEVASVDDEALMDAVTAVSGSGPAYVFHFIECLIAAGRKAGLPDDTARLLAIQTVHGAASLAASSSEEPGELRRQVTSPNGTTAAALEVLMGEDRLKRLVEEAVEASRRRSIELGS